MATCPAATTSPLRVGMSLSLSGPYSALAGMQAKGCRLWEADVNRRGGLLGRRIELVVRDDASDPARAASAYEQLIREDRVDLLLGPYSSAITAAVAPVAQRHRHPLLAVGGASDELWNAGYDHLFGLYPLTSRYALGALSLFREAGIERIAVIGLPDAGPRSVAEGARKWAPVVGLRLVAFAIAASGVEDFERLAVQARDAGAQALLLAGRLDEGVAMRRVLKALAWSPPYYVSAGAAMPRYHEQLGADAQGTFGTSLWEPRPDLAHPGSPDFLRDFLQRFGEAPSYHAALCFAGGQLLEQAVARAGSAERPAVRRALATLDTTTIIGRYAADATGAQARALALIVQWQGGKREIVWPSELRTAPPLFVR
ncbi:amino acid ABC transporter substrate-binding protein [Aquabacterium humicola]|uniref:amino acid ABC transporter substrate-binding protein n=1 Tax=Aquabacterium humicola TaxID=3237377 RepID=UPI002542958B|nr:amino acid ABC transporter substrate-binding protein [Rubrivivax pictus]